MTDRGTHSTPTEREWERQYDEAMQWRDWQTCDLLLEERENADWYTGPRMTPGWRRAFKAMVRLAVSR